MVSDESGIAAVIQAVWQLDPAFVSPARVLVEVPAGALDGGHQDLARRYAFELIEQLEGMPDDPEMRVRLLHDIAAALVDVGQKRPAASVCHEAVPVTAGFVEVSGASQGLGYSGMGDRALALGDLAEELGRCGDADGAWSVGLQALDAAATSLARRQVCQAVGLRIARGMVAAGSSQQVRDAIQLTGQASGPHWVAEIVMANIGLMVAPLLHAAGEGREASAYLEFASRVVGGLDSDEADDLRGSIVITLDETDQLEKALQGLDAIQDPFIRASCLRKLAERRADEGNADQGARLAHRSLDGLEAIDRLIDRIDTQAGAAYALARCGVIHAARDLATTALEGLRSLDSQWHPRPLGYIAATAVLIDDRSMADQTFALATDDFKAADDPYPLVEVARKVAHTGRSAELERILGLADELASPGLAQDLNGPVIGAYLDANDLETALRSWRTLLGNDQLADLPALTRTLNRGVHALAALDRGHTLIELHRALSEVRGWWPSHRPGL
jgi:hypothetical protein